MVAIIPLRNLVKVRVSVRVRVKVRIKVKVRLRLSVKVCPHSLARRYGRWRRLRVRICGCSAVVCKVQWCVRDSGVCSGV